MSTVPFSGGANGGMMHDAPAWRGGTIFAIALHAGLAAAIAFAHFARSTPPAAPAAITLELAPLVSAQPEPDEALPEGPKEEAEPEPAPVPEPPLPRDAIPEPEKKPEPKKKEARKATAPIAQKLPEAERTAAPADAQANLAEARLMPSYMQGLLGHLERYKKYPRSARRRGEEGKPVVRFEIDRKGNLIFHALVESSGNTTLDEGALATVKRADPFPPLPKEIRGDTKIFDVPVNFSITR
jgi:periplasmic protein TonB